jgi:hypothetical protein
LLEAELVLERGRQFLSHGRGLRADIDALSALRAGNSVDCRFGGEIAIERDGAAGIVVAGNDKGDPVRITIGVDDRGNGNTKPLRFLNGDVFLVGVDDEDEIRQAAHVLYAAERAIKLVAFALQRQAFLLGIALRLV